MAKQRARLDLIISDHEHMESTTPNGLASYSAEIPAAAPAPTPAAKAPPTTRRDRPHTTLYLDKATQRTIKEIALQYDMKAHDLFIEGINMMLAHYGRPPISKT